MERAALPVMQHRDTRWPPHRRRECEIDRLQRKMVAPMLQIPRLLGEMPTDYIRRRNRAATVQIKRGGWSDKHCRRVLAWDAHCRRPCNHASWAASLLDYRGADWLTVRRGQEQHGTESRLNCRALRGVPATRWHEGVDHALLKLHG